MLCELCVRLEATAYLYVKSFKGVKLARRIPVARASDLVIRSSQQSFGRDEYVVITVIKCGCHLQYVTVTLLFSHNLPMFGLSQ